MGGRELHNPPLLPAPPSTRFHGSKRKLLGWLWEHLRDLPFHTCLDAFGGSASVSCFLKRQGKAVTFNDLLQSSALSGIALVENNGTHLSTDDVNQILRRDDKATYDDLIERTFDGIYFTAEENAWLDRVVQNIASLGDRRKRAMAFHALFQAAMVKRPYNLFHRKNLYMRLAEVERSFGNKTTWDRPFAQTFCRFVDATNAAVVDAAPCTATCGDALNVAGEFDLVYVDPPYINARGVGVDYLGLYHFLEGMAAYDSWEARIDFTTKHRRLKKVPCRWTSPATIHDAFIKLFDRHRNSILAVSYRSDGIPSLEELSAMLAKVKSKVEVHVFDRGYKYALSTNWRSSEALLIGTD